MPRVALLLAAVLVALLAGAACGGAEEVAQCPEGSELNVEYRLFMGRNSGGEEVVTDQAWEVFLRDIVTPKFPNGLTVLDGQGQWQVAPGEIERERSKVLIILAPRFDNAGERLAEIAIGYKDLFNQGAVIQTTNGTCTSFY